MATVMIVGATRGIGLELVRQYAAQGDNVIACARDTEAAALLDTEAANHTNIRIEQLDEYLNQGWKVLQQGNEIVTVYWK